MDKTSVADFTPAPRVLTRIYISPEGDLIVTDLWEEVETDLIKHGFGLTNHAETAETGGHFLED